MRKKPSIEISDDYAMVKFGRLTFYYGYEETIPEEPVEGEDWEYAFVVRRGKKELVRWDKKYIVKRIADDADLWGPESVLIAGMATWMSDNGIK